MRERHQRRQSIGGRRGKTWARRRKPVVLEFVGSIDEEFIVDDRSTGAGARPVVVEAVFYTAVLLQIVECVVIPIAVITPSRTVPVIGTGLCHNVELPASRMPVLGGELIGE